MQAEMKEAMLTILQGRKYVFSLFHTLLGAEPTAEMLAVASGEDSLSIIALFEEETPAAGMLMQALTAVRGAEAAHVEAIRGEYTRLFLGPEKLPAPPWESVYTTKERALFQESMLAVREWYHNYGYAPSDSPNYPDDHISLMLHFLERMTDRTIACIKDGALCGCSNMLEAQKLFEENHLLNWVGRYAQDMQASETKLLYPQAAQAMAAFIAYDRRLIAELLDSCHV